ncbi:MAG: carbohydrate ABC transporter permease [Clostridia bacterium]|nr:carbohydrate ABC transporter permease [Clostridia bacterium]
MDNTQKNFKVMKESKNKIRVEFEDRTPFWERLKKKVFSVYFLKNVVWYIFRFILMIGVCYVILFPFFSKIAGSFMAPQDFMDATVNIIPKNFTLGTYKAIIIENRYFEAFLNTTLLSLTVALLQTFVACLIGYGLAKFKFKGNTLIFMLVIFTMIVPHQTLKLSMWAHFRRFDIGGIQALGIPGLFKFITGIFNGGFANGYTLNVMDTFVPLIVLSICGLGFKNGLYIFMMRQFFRGVPDELEESAYVDGSNTFRTFFQIILPLSVPMMITIFLFAFSWQWTDDFYTKVFFLNNDVWLMPNIVDVPPSLEALFDLTSKDLYQTAIENTAGIMIILPLVVIYLFCQKYLVQGIERSGLVG